MIYKIFLRSLPIVTAIIISSFALSAAGPEWLAEKHRNNPAVISTVSELVYAAASTAIIAQVPFKDGRFFGRTLPTKPDIEHPFLRYVKEQSASGPIYTIEFGCSVGSVSLKVPFCFQNSGLHIGIDLSKEAIILAKDSKGLLAEQYLENSCAFKAMDCLEILEKAPKYAGKINAIYSQNLCHFFNPSQTCKFFSNIEVLLVPGGRAFICADAPSGSGDVNHYKAMEKNTANIFPGFITSESLNINWGREKGISTLEEKIFSDTDPKCGTLLISTEQVNASFQGAPPVQKMATKERTTTNFFTPEVFRRVIALHPALEIIDTYLMDRNGLRLPDEALTMYQSAVTIIQKRA